MPNVIPNIASGIMDNFWLVSFLRSGPPRTRNCIEANFNRRAGVVQCARADCFWIGHHLLFYGVGVGVGVGAICDASSPSSLPHVTSNCQMISNSLEARFG